ncbi:hypothetical protein CP97_09655 [Aurantiacibacter atlanticus]|uniref:Phosphodiester glycosidase domain-containing protein n=1 Tax=Aurantiacibacter atlanticus TaxID=1648404 RepID=A0A0H4W1G1_9SPHN|nr:phosphodiester glycosidase family protein [Aurantiacibacter atlanticus]AKQ43348.2 hypothetical protein CP97_09655 [Aurantiacibacter atlanticus]MDF1833649.1 phosphodiester glycosidase family protein [Alteraurantiacibacter sp. bin_em_oilr2.035]
MKIRALALPFFGLLAGCEIHFEGEQEEVRVSICQPVMFEQTPLTLCTVEPAKHEIGVVLAPEGNETPYRSLRALAHFTEEVDGPEIALAVNGGMFDEDGMPIGYYVEDGRRIGMLNQNDGPGNFHLMPNGIFFGRTGGPWQVMDTPAFARDIQDRPDFATQSGPMLVIKGELHPEIQPDGQSRKIRNAVGVDALGRAHFIISEAPISFGKLARYYRDVLNVGNALYLDGSVSMIWDPATGRLDTGASIGPLIVVQNRAEIAE